MKQRYFNRRVLAFLALLLAVIFISISCEETNGNIDDLPENGGVTGNSSAVFLLIDEESIDNGNEPNNFTAIDVNDQLATVGLRTQLKYFKDNVGKTINLYTGEVGDEGWHALITIPSSWINAGPTGNGLKNFLAPGPGLGGGTDNKEVLLDKISDVTPLRATGIAMLKGHTILAVVYDSDVSINYSPLLGNLQGANLGIVAFKVLEVTKRTNGSDKSLPVVKIEILNADLVKNSELYLFMNAPVPKSSSEPVDITPPANPGKIELTKAR